MLMTRAIVRVHKRVPVRLELHTTSQHSPSRNLVGMPQVLLASTLCRDRIHARIRLYIRGQ